MYLLYLDASGHSDFPPPYGKGKDTNYVLGGLAITDDKWDLAYKGLEEIRQPYFPSHPPLVPEVRYGDLINKRGLWNTLTEAQRKDFADKVFDLIKSLTPVLFVVKVDKPQHFLKYQYSSQGVEPPRLLALRFMIPRFSKFLQRVHDRGMMIYDSETVRNDAPLRDFVFKGRFAGVVLETNPFYDSTAPYRTQNKLEGILESIFFVNSRESPVMQLADFCSHAAWTHFERSKSDRFNEIRHLLDHDGGQVFGLKEWP